MNKKVKKALTSLLVVLSAATLLSGCMDDDNGDGGGDYDNTDDKLSSDGTSSKRSDDLDDDVVHTNKISYKRFRAQGKTCFKLAYFESFVDTEDTSQGHFALGYWSGGRIYNLSLGTKADNFRVVIVPGITTPFVYKTKKKDGDPMLYIYRAPYQQYNQPVISGKVTKKLGK